MMVIGSITPFLTQLETSQLLEAANLNEMTRIQWITTNHLKDNSLALPPK